MSETLLPRWRGWNGLTDPLGAVRAGRWWRTAGRVLEASEKLQNVPDEELLVRGRELAWQARSGEPLASLVVEAYSLVREAARRELGFLHYPVQIVGGTAMFEGFIIEMQTGEGKTLTTTLPAFLRGMTGRGCHVITVNDYLAQRDAERMGGVYRRLGLSTGCILTEMEDDVRREAYARDITYATAKEVGFDFLRDRLKREASNPHLARRWAERWPKSLRENAIARNASGSQAPTLVMPTQSDATEQLVHRGFHCALLDEADSILLDEARTPLIIGLTTPNAPSALGLLRWGRTVADGLEPVQDFVFDPEQRRMTLTERGCRRVLLWPKPTLIDGIDTERLYETVEQALLAGLGFHRDRDYVIHEEKVSIVDESTGRMMEGRKWEDGLHQAIEVKERIPVTAATGEAARVTVQTFFREYEHIAGMTGTAVSAAGELKRTYGLKVAPIPTHRPCLRTGRPARVFVTLEAKRRAVADEIERLRAAGRAVLVGTPSVAASEGLGAVLQARGIPHVILNARQNATEADIVAQAGQPARVTIATNMAGRGTDILLHESVQKAGGLHVITTEIHSSARIDRQLIGRAARQGDPGSYQFFLSLEDELLGVMPPARQEAIRRSARPDAGGELPASWESLFLKTQRLIERRDSKQRKDLLKAERQRREAHRRMGLDPCLELPE